MHLHAMERQRRGRRKWIDLVPPVPPDRCASTSSCTIITSSSTSGSTLGDGFHMTRMKELAAPCIGTSSWTMMMMIENCALRIFILDGRGGPILAGRSVSLRDLFCYS
jgi:hypothetical protein